MQSTKRVPAILGKSLVMPQGQRSNLKPVGLDEEEVWPTVSISINRVTTFDSLGKSWPLYLFSFNVSSHKACVHNFLIAGRLLVIETADLNPDSITY